MKQKKTIALFLIFIIAISISSPCSLAVSAANKNGDIPITPFWINTSSIVCDLVFSGKTATCTGSVDAYSGATISATLTLYKVNGSSREYVTSWTKSSAISSLCFNETYKVSSSGTYIAVLTATVTRNGTNEPVSKESNQKTCS